jgi:GTP pyrophosphokinase
MDNAFLTDLKIIGTDRVGLINDVTNIISGELRVNMRAMTIATDQGIFEGKITLYVQDTRHLEVMIRKLQKVNGVVKVTRIDTGK